MEAGGRESWGCRIKKKAVCALPGLELFSPHFHSFLLPPRSHSTGGYTNKPVLKLLHQHHWGIWPQIPVVKHFVFHQVKKSCSFCKQGYILPWVKMSICWNLAESKISSFLGPDRFYPSSVSHHHLNQLFLSENLTENRDRSGKWGLFSWKFRWHQKSLLCFVTDLVLEMFCYSKNKWL